MPLVTIDAQLESTTLEQESLRSSYQIQRLHNLVGRKSYSARREGHIGTRANLFGQSYIQEEAQSHWRPGGLQRDQEEEVRAKR